MNFQKIFIASGVALALSMTPVAAGQTADELQKEFDETLATLQSYSAEQRDEFAADAERALKDIDARLDRLDEQIDEKYDDTKADARREWKENVAELRQKRMELAAWYAEASKDSKGTWPRIKQSFSNAYRDIAGAVRDTVRSLEN